MSFHSAELDIETIRSRVTRAGAFSLPRWIVTDVNALLAEVDRLRAGSPPVAYGNEMRKKDSRIWVLERDLTALKAAHAAEVARLEKIATAERQAAAAMEYEAEAERLSVVEYLRNFADDTPPGPVSPVRKAAQDFARRTATFIEVGNHRRAAVKEAS
jgi:hypothetical protein